MSSLRIAFIYIALFVAIKPVYGQVNIFRDANVSVELTLAKVSGDNQSGCVNDKLMDVLKVSVVNKNGDGVAGATLEFTVTAKPTNATDGSFSSTTVTTDANGEAETEYTLGDMAGAYEITVTATDPEVNMGSPQAFNIDAVVVEVTQIANAQTLRSNTLDDQVITGTRAEFEATVDLTNLPTGSEYFLRWTFLGTSSSWEGPFTTATSGKFEFDVPPDATHKLDEELMVELRVDQGNVCFMLTRDMKVFFDLVASNDTHNRSSGNSDANWFRHWGTDNDNAVNNFSATGTVSFFGRNASFTYGGASGGIAQYDGNTSSPKFTLFDAAKDRLNVNFSSASMSYTDSQGNSITSPAGAISIIYDKSGIDVVELNINHEAEHLHTDLRWLAPNGDWFLAYGTRMADNGDGVLQPGENDFDNDEIPNLVEDANLGFRWDVRTTHAGFFLSGDDEEVWIENIVQSTGNGTAANDWALEGKQSNPSN